METTNNKLSQIKKIIMVGLGLTTFSFLVTLLATGLDNSDTKQLKTLKKEETRIELEFKKVNQELMTQKAIVEEAVTAAEKEIKVFSDMNDRTKEIRAARADIKTQIDDWINEGFDMSQ